MGLRLRLVDHDAHQLVRLAQPLLQLLAILVEVDRLLRHAGLHGSLGDRGRFPDQHARIERLGDDVVAAELQASRRHRRGSTESGTSSLASAASARVAASFISSLMVVARTSSAPRKMNGKPRTLLTWLG